VEIFNNFFGAEGFSGDVTPPHPAPLVKGRVKLDLKIKDREINIRRELIPTLLLKREGLLRDRIPNAV
jgi:hypothetical protein